MGQHIISIQKVKEIVFGAYPQVFDFDIKRVYNGGDTLKVIVTVRKTLNQTIPTRLKIEIKKNDVDDFRMDKIYETRLEKIQALKDNNQIDSFLAEIIGDLSEEDIENFKENNKDILQSNESPTLENDIIRKVLENRLAQLRE